MYVASTRVATRCLENLAFPTARITLFQFTVSLGGTYDHLAKLTVVNNNQPFVSGEGLPNSNPALIMGH